MEKFNRGVRRHHIERLKRIRRKLYWGAGWGFRGSEPLDQRLTGKAVSHPATCSSPFCCGNPRAVYGRTLKEITQMIEKEEGIAETCEKSGEDCDII